MSISSQSVFEPVRIRYGHDNFFTPLRLIFALLVMIGHAFSIGLGGPDKEPAVFLDYTFSYLAVNLFFIASGFLVTKSMLYRGDMPQFASARILRIFPALIVHVAFIMLIIGPLATSLPLKEFFFHPDFIWQPLRVLTFYQTGLSLPGIFETNGEQLGSAPLWTLRYEVLCYIATGLIFALGLMRRKWMVLAQFIVPSLLWIAGQAYGVFDQLPATFENMVRFGIAYGLGAVFFAYRDRLRFYWLSIPILAGICWLLRDTSSVEIAMNMMMGSLLILIAYARAPKLERLQSLDDISYGLYIYHWGVMQLIFHWFPDITITTLFLTALPIVTGLAWLSWTYVEKPMLKYKTGFGDWLTFGKKETDRPRKAVLLD